MVILVIGQEVIYSNDTWNILKSKRKKALDVMEALEGLSLNLLAVGSIARGDVREESDIDIVITEYPQPYKVEILLGRRGYRIYRKVIIQATPSYTPKAYLYLDPYDEIVVSFPLSKLKPREVEFYKWGGCINYKEIEDNKRTPGINKELKVIIPTEFGHVEYPIFGMEGKVSKILKISISTIMERERVLTRRRELGRTGVFLEYEINADEPIESVMKKLSRDNVYFRKAISS